MDSQQQEKEDQDKETGIKKKIKETVLLYIVFLAVRQFKGKMYKIISEI